MLNRGTPAHKAGFLGLFGDTGMNVAAAQDLAQEARYLAALRATYPQKVAEIQRQWRAAPPHERPAARRRLIARFGQDLVDLAIAELAG